jgi:hypothetical protein
LAIKGKSRKRSRPKAPALPPRPTVSSRKTRLVFRRDVKRGVVIVLAVLALLGGLRVWENDSRSSALRTFNQKLALAQSKFLSYFAQSSPASVDQNVSAFTQGTIGGGAFITLADLWEKDFTAAEQKVAKLKAPNPLAEEAKFLMQQGINGYVGVVRLYNLAGQLKLVADSEKDAAQKKILNDKIQVLLEHADQWRKQRADILYARGATNLTALNIRYGIEKKQPPAGSQNTGGGTQ